MLKIRLFESLNRGLLCLRANVAVSFEHLTADVARESLYRLLANVRILSQPQDERVSHILAGGLEVYKKRRIRDASSACCPITRRSRQSSMVSQH